MKKRISLIMAIVMAMSVFASIPAIAANIMVPEKTLISQDFTELTELPEGWTASTNGTLDGGFKIPEGKSGNITSPEYDAEGMPYDINATFYMTAQYKNIYFAKTASTSYRVYFSGDDKGNQTVTLYKGSEQLAQTTETKLIWKKVLVTIKVDMDSISVLADGTELLKYENTYTSELSSGTIRFESNWRQTTLYDLSVIRQESELKPESTGASVEFAQAEAIKESFTTTAENVTEEAIAALNEKDEDGNYKSNFDVNGWTLKRVSVEGSTGEGDVAANTTWNQKNWLQLKKRFELIGNKTITNMDDPFELSYVLGTNSNNSNLYFGDFEAGNYYKLNFRLNDSFLDDTSTKNYKKAVIISRYDNNIKAFSKEIIITTSTSTIYAPTYIVGTLTYDGTDLKLDQDGVTATVNEDWAEWTIWPQDANGLSLVDSGKLKAEVGNCHLYINSIKFTALEKTVTANDFLLNRTFTSEDTEQELLNDGWTTVASNTNTIKGNVLQYNAKISGNYTVEMNSCKAQNDTYIFLRYDPDTKTGYAVKSRMSSGNYVSFGRVINGEYTEVQKYTTSSKWDKPTATFTASIEDIGNDVKLTLRVIYGNQDTSWEWIDVKSDENEPIKTAGAFAVFAGDKWSSPKVNYIKAYPTSKGERTIADAKVRYYVDNNLVDGFTEGVASINMPTAVLGESFVIIAALYDNGVMKEVKSIDAIDAYEFTGAELFDTTGVSENSYVATYIWRDFAGVEPLKEATLLN